MTTVQTAGAVSRDAAEWLAIDWQSVNRNVRRLQVRIVQAWKAGKWNKVKALQRLLTCSYSGKGFDFLGQNVRRYPNGRLFTKPSKKNV